MAHLSGGDGHRVRPTHGHVLQRVLEQRLDQSRCLEVLASSGLGLDGFGCSV
jgi:hypothetical protein